MAPSKIIKIEDLPPDLKQSDGSEPPVASGWQDALRLYIQKQFADNRENILETLEPEFERILIETALDHTGQRKIDAARILGWGRNTLTRKLKDLGIEV
jgi:two-component system nitrogen regulation response regulator GlnG